MPLFHATVSVSQHGLNNLLNPPLLIRIETKCHHDTDRLVSKPFDKMVYDAQHR